LAPILLFLLGVVNILSVITPTLVERMKYLVDFIPYNVIEVSNTMVIVIGIAASSPRDYYKRYMFSTTQAEIEAIKSRFPNFIELKEKYEPIREVIIKIETELELEFRKILGI